MSGFANTVVDECESTNDLARQLAESGAPHGTWVSTRRQGAGRGRLGRKWESIEGNLFLSVIARFPSSGSSAWVSWIPLATAVAVAECLRDFNPKLSVEIKWPNDLWLDRRKLGGILCEAVGNRDESFVIIGIGLNCVGAPQGLDQPTVSITDFLANARVTADEIRAAVIASLLEILDELKSKGPTVIRPRYERLAALRPGTEIEWKSGEKVSQAVVESLGPSGELLVHESGSGPAIRLYAEDVKVLRTFW